MGLSAILALLGSIADPIANVFQSTSQTKTAKISAESLDEQLKLAESQNDAQKIELAKQALALKTEEAKQKTTQQAIQGSILVALAGILLFFAFKPKAQVKPKPI